MRSQTPTLPCGTYPLTRAPLATVIHHHGDLAHDRVQGQAAGLPLAQGGKAPLPAGLALATVAPIAGGSIPALRPALELRFPSVTFQIVLTSS